MIVDAQVHTWASRASADGPYPWDPARLRALPPAARRAFDAAPRTSDVLRTMMDEVGVDVALLTSPWIYGDDHSYALDSAQRHPERFAVVGPFGVPMADPKATLSVFTAQPTVVGPRLFLAPPTSVGHEQYRADVDEFLVAAAAVGTTVFLGPMGRLDEAHRVATEFPDVLFVLDHLGLWCDAPVPARLALVDDLLALADRPNVLLKCSAVPELSAQPYPFEDLWPVLHRIIGAFGAQRLMWGSDINQHLDELSYRESLDYLRLSNEIDSEAKRFILGDTARVRVGIPAERSTASPS